MYLVEQHIIQASDPRWVELDAACFRSKNIYNAANYRLRQAYIFQQRYIPYEKLEKSFKQRHLLADQQLPAKVVQQVLKQLDHDWQSFFKAMEAYKQQPEKFKGRPQLPHYKDKAAGRNLLTYTRQALRLHEGTLALSQLPMVIQTNQHAIQQVRIVPRRSHYVIEVVYLATQPDTAPTPYRAAMDINLNNLAALTSDKPGFAPLLVNGRPLKSINQWYNKRRAALQSQIDQPNADPGLNAVLSRMTDKRNRQVNHYLHCASRQIIDLLTQEHLDTLIIGKNPNWKQDITLGKRNNQNFVSIPHARFIDMLDYKAKLVGIRVVIIEESYTSKCSFLDLEPIGKHDEYAGQRVKRGWFRSKEGKFINADVNGSYNILRKASPEAWTRQGVGDAVVHPSTLHIIT
jgi:putative transposase